MKVLPVLLALTATALAHPDEPGQSALRFLEKVRSKTLNLEPGGDTALAAPTSQSKRQEIARRLDRMARDLGTEALEVGAQKIDGDLAAVLVRKSGGFDPSELQVFPVAMVKRNTDWLATPVPASFENSGIAYAQSIRQRVATLENWMLHEQARDLELLRDQSAERLRQKIAATLPPAILRACTPYQAAERFLTACEQRNLPAILALLGGISTTLPDDWPLRLTAANAAVAATDPPPSWRLLISPDVLRATVHREQDGDAAQVSIACLDPTTEPARTALPRVELIHLELSKSPDGLWRINPPGNLLQPLDHPDDTTDETLDADLLNAFPTQLAAQHPPSPKATPDAALQGLLETLQRDRPDEFIRFIRLDGDPAATRIACARAIQFRWTLREPSTVHSVVPLAMHTDGDLAAAACQCFSARTPDQLNLKILYFTQSSNGWSWMPEPPLRAVTSLHEWTDLQSQHWPDNWQRVFLTECPQLAAIPDTPAPAEQPARQLVEAWLQATRAGDVTAALRLTARLSTPDSEAALLRNLGYEMTGARRNSKPPTITRINRNGSWTTVGTRADPNGKPSFPVYPVVNTPAGPRILLEIDLFASTNRSRDFLNQTALDRLRQASPTAADALKSLFGTHQAEISQSPPP